MTTDLTVILPLQPKRNSHIKKGAGTFTKGPITPAKACPEFNPKTAIATAISNSKLFPAAVNEMNAFLS